MNKDVSKRQLRAALQHDFEQLLGQITGAVNDARPGRIIADSEEPVRDAMADFRQAAFEKALELRQRNSEPAFPPSAESGEGPLEE